MRRNIFLHFMNRDTREIFKVYETLSRGNHARALREPLNACAMLCEEACYAPPGFVLEDELAFQLFESQAPYLDSGLVQLPLRERSLADYAEKKRGEYAPARSRYTGLFDDTRLDKLSSFGTALTLRKSQIGPAIVDGFQIGVDAKSKIWKSIRDKASPAVIQNLRDTPTILADQGKALTWSIMQPLLLREGASFHREARDALQHVYFKEYCTEFKLVLLSDIPYMLDTFFLPVERQVYSFKRFKNFLDSIGVAQMFLRASADFIVKARKQHGFIELMDAYVGLVGLFANDTSVSYHVSRAKNAVSFDWNGLASRREGLLGDPTMIELLEIVDGCRELAAKLTVQHDLPVRSKPDVRQTASPIIVQKGSVKMKMAVFVALEEELTVLARQLNLTRQPSLITAVGKINDVEIEVLCPRAMGRVAAAVEVTRYLAECQAKPNLMLCVGLAGGFAEEKVDPGMVLCIDTVVDLANRKVGDEAGNVNSQFRRKDFDCSRAIYSIAKSTEFDIPAWEKHCRDNFDWPTGRTPSLKEGKIASVDEVVASDEHRKKMIKHTEKLLGVEMEAGGVCAASQKFKVPVGILRVVSDMADPSKADDVWRARGMKTLCELILRLPLKRVIEEVEKN